MEQYVQKSDIKPKKQFGQNFLADSYYIQKIIESIPFYQECHLHKYRLIEIGTGLGDLTGRLLDCGSLLTYEIDRELEPYLSHKFYDAIQSGRLHLVFGDILKLWERDKSLCNIPYILVSNLPYYIATAVLLRALRDTQCKALVVMTQKEVAEKFCAKEGTALCSPFSVVVQSVGYAQIICNVPPESFNPSPKVVSSLFSIVRTQEITLEPLEAFLKIAFSSPRKKLCNNLAKKYSMNSISKAFEVLGINEKIRAHQLTAPHYHQLIRLLEKG